MIDHFQRRGGLKTEALEGNSSRRRVSAKGLGTESGMASLPALAVDE